MKTWILAMAMMVGVTMSAQKPERHNNERGTKKVHHDLFTPEQKAELRAKHLTLQLDLSDKQQTEMKKLFLANAQEMKKAHEQHKANREAGKKPTQDERFAMETKKLDTQITNKREIKKILTADQYQKFEKMKEGHNKKFMKRAKKLKKQHRR
jgi:protein CpxP